MTTHFCFNTSSQLISHLTLNRQVPNFSVLKWCCKNRFLISNLLFTYFNCGEVTIILPCRSAKFNCVILQVKILRPRECKFHWQNREKNPVQLTPGSVPLPQSLYDHAFRHLSRKDVWMRMVMKCPIRQLYVGLIPLWIGYGLMLFRQTIGWLSCLLSSSLIHILLLMENESI